MADCPNCGKDVPEGERLCPSCGFDTGEAQADDVRALREAGRIHPGRLGADSPTDFSGGPLRTGDEQRGATDQELPAEAGSTTPHEEQSGL
jgi:hypothetical protein